MNEFTTKIIQFNKLDKELRKILEDVIIYKDVIKLDVWRREEDEREDDESKLQLRF